MAGYQPGGAGQESPEFDPDFAEESYGIFQDRLGFYDVFPGWPRPRPDQTAFDPGRSDSVRGGPQNFQQMIIGGITTGDITSTTLLGGPIVTNLTTIVQQPPDTDPDDLPPPGTSLPPDPDNWLADWVTITLDVCLADGTPRTMQFLAKPI